MANTTPTETSNRNYRLTIEMYERCMKDKGLNLQSLLDYGNSLALSGRLKESLDVYCHCYKTGQMTHDKLEYLTNSLLEIITSESAKQINSCFVCPSCDFVLYNPTTLLCGHTFCRKCVVNECLCCQKKSASSSPETNVLVKELVEKWWKMEINSVRMCNDGNQHVEAGNLTVALGKYNQSLELAPSNHIALSNRSRILCKLRRYDSALVDANNIIKLKPAWGKGYYRRGVALSALGHYEEAITAFSLSAVLNCNPSSVKHDITRALHRLLLDYSGRPHRSSSVGSYSTSKHKRNNLPCTLSDCENISSGEEDILQLQLMCVGTRQEVSKFHSLVDKILLEAEKIRNIERKSTELFASPNLVNLCDFECVLCCRMLWRPVTTPCGHTYCMTCLDRCLDYTTTCPLCMTSLSDYLTSSQKHVTEFIEYAMQSVFPMQYSSRQENHSQELSELKHSPGERQPHIPVFVCTTSFPSVPCPLFVYEPRYRAMIRRCVQAGTRQFGIAACLNKSSGVKKYADFGTMLEIRDWLLLADGCSIITTIGARRFRVIARGERDGYDTAKVEFLKDSAIPRERIPGIKILHEHVRRKSIEWFKSISSEVQSEIERTFGIIPEVEYDWLNLPDGPSWTWWLLAILPLGQQLQIGILATTSLEKRLRAINKTLDHIKERLQQRSVHADAQEGRHHSNTSSQQLIHRRSRRPLEGSS